MAAQRVFLDRDGLARARYAAEPGTTYLIRPDQHVAARFRRLDAEEIRTALARAGGDASVVRSAA
jgi:3-(3-hydroxy-phenyl)propionate hydroxylase